jgi:hypothetical protein
MDEEHEDFAAKLILIEQEARLVMEDLRSGAMRERVQQILTVAQLLRARLNVASSVILPAQRPMNEEQQDFAAKLLLIQNEANFVLRDLPPGIVRDRLQHIATVAEMLLARIGTTPGEPKAAIRPR